MAKLYHLNARELRPLLYLLLRGPATTAEIIERTGLSSTQIRGGLGALRSAGWIAYAGRIWSVADPLRMAAAEVIGAGNPGSYYGAGNPGSEPEIRAPSTEPEIRAPSRKSGLQKGALGAGNPGSKGGTIGGDSFSSVRTTSEVKGETKPLLEIQTSEDRTSNELEERFREFWALDRVFRRRPHRRQVAELFVRICRGREAKTREIVRELGLPPEGVAERIVRGCRALQAEMADRPEDKRKHADSLLRSGIWAEDPPLELPHGADEDLVRRIIRERTSKPETQWVLGTHYGDLDAAKLRERDHQARVIREMEPRWAEWLEWYRR